MEIEHTKKKTAQVSEECSAPYQTEVYGSSSVQGFKEKIQKAFSYIEKRIPREDHAWPVQETDRKDYEH